MPPDPNPQISIVVPVLNEAQNLPGLFCMLAKQQRVAFELILSDGGSEDGSLAVAGTLAKTMPFGVRGLEAEAGRAAQLNAGARLARGRWLLFLHADSEFADPLALARSISVMSEADRAAGKEGVAGHFALRFKDQGDGLKAAYAYYEFKATLNRAECTHGDQGFLMSKALFEQLGPFDETLPLLEDTCFAEKVRACGRWLLLPAEIYTSARRFETEGLLQRQVLNALIMNFAAIGWDEFFEAAPGVYRRQDRTSKLRLRPFFALVRNLLGKKPLRERARLWYLTGCYVRGHAWQLVLARTVRRNLRDGNPPGLGSEATLQSFERWFSPLTDNLPGRVAATVFVWLWFHLVWGWMGLREEGADQGGQ